MIRLLLFLQQQNTIHQKAHKIAVMIMNDGRNFATFLYFLTQIGNKLILLGRNMESIEIKFLVYVIKRLLVIFTEIIEGSVPKLAPYITIRVFPPPPDLGVKSVTSIGWFGSWATADASLSSLQLLILIVEYEFSYSCESVVECKFLFLRNSLMLK